jgi:hypothetical protein
MGSDTASRRIGGFRVAVNALRRHYPEYLIEATGLCLFMISAAVFTVLLNPHSAGWIFN